MYQKRHRTTFNQYQLNVLEEAFRHNSYPNPSFREALAAKTNLDASRVQVWFQNRRAKRKKQVNQAIRFAAAVASSSSSSSTSTSSSSISSSSCSTASSSSSTNHAIGRPLLGGVPQQTIEHCAALQQQMALDLHLNSAAAICGLQQQSPSSTNTITLTTATNGSTGTLANGLMDQVNLYGTTNECASQLLSANGLDLQFGVQNEDSNNLLYSQHWLNCSNALNQQQQQQHQDHSHLHHNHHHQHQQQIFDNFVNQQVMQTRSHHQQDHLLSTSSVSSTTSSSSQQSNKEAQCVNGQQHQQQEPQLQGQESGHHQLQLSQVSNHLFPVPSIQFQPNNNQIQQPQGQHQLEESLGPTLATAVKLETQNFHQYNNQQRQQQQKQQNPEQQQQEQQQQPCNNYYKQINSISRSTVDYLH